MDPTIFRIELPCPHCGKKDLQLIGDLVGKDEIACRYCRGVVDLTDEKWQAGLREYVEGFRKLFVDP